MLKQFTGCWVEELLAVLWSLRTTPNRSTGSTPFFLTYGSEAVLPSDLDYGAPRVKAFDPEMAAEGCHGNFGGSKASNVTPVGPLSTNFV